MKFSINRKIMLECLKSMIRVVPTNSPIKELGGFLVEVDEDDGYVYITATNIETSIKRRVKASIETEGKFVIKATLLTDMLTRLAGDDVCFEEIKEGCVKITSGSCTYDIAVLVTENFPKCELPYPEDTVKISCLKHFYDGTSSAVCTDKDFNTLSGIHFEIVPDKISVSSCNRLSCSIVEDKTESGGRLAFTITKQALSYLTSATGDDAILEAGVYNRSIVFFKEDMIFSTKMLQYEFVDVAGLISRLDNSYTAKVEYDDFKEKMVNVFDMAMFGKEKSYIKCVFKENEIELSTQNDVCSTKGSVLCVTVGDIKEQTFYYPAKNLKDILNSLSGTMVFSLDKRGYLLVFNRTNKYMLTPLSDKAVELKEKRIAEAKTGKPKRQTSGKKTEKAA